MWLFDVNATISLLDPMHVNHEAMHTWFAERNPLPWATCPIVENGVVRVLSQPSYPGGRRTPAEVIGILTALKRDQAGIHQTIPDDISIADSAIFIPEYVAGPKKVRDAYLLGLAFARGLRLVSFDRSLPWQAIRGGSAALLVHPGGGAGYMLK